MDQNLPAAGDAAVNRGGGAIRAIETLTRLAAASSVHLAPPRIDGSPGVDVVVQNMPRVTLSREEAATALGMSLDSFERHVQSDLRMVRRGRLRLVPVSELERWAEEAAERTLQ
jgi:hypothetical protein